MVDMNVSASHRSINSLEIKATNQTLATMVGDALLPGLFVSLISVDYDCDDGSFDMLILVMNFIPQRYEIRFGNDVEVVLPQNAKTDCAHASLEVVETIGGYSHLRCCQFD